MDSQPNEIITHILSYVDNYTLMFARSTCHKWKNLIETRIFYKKNIPALHVCIMTDDYYHFGKYYLDYNYDTRTFIYQTNEAIYYNNLVAKLTNKTFFHNVIPQTNSNVSIDQLLVYASYQGHLEVTKYLISTGADLHAMNDYALRWSAENGHLEVTKYLISIGVNIHANNDAALRLSAEEGHLEVVKYLISIGANINANNDYIFKYGALNIIEYLKSISGKN